MYGSILHACRLKKKKTSNTLLWLPSEMNQCSLESVGSFDELNRARFLVN